MKSTLIACLALATLSITSCKKDKDEAVTPTKENLAGTYTITAMASSVNGSEKSVLNELMPEACDRDDTYTLSVDGKFTVTDAGTKCDPVNDESSTWSLSTNSKIIVAGEEATIESFNGTQLVVSEDYSSAGMPAKVKTTFTKK